ncbi:MAG TPA: Hsp20/alpha crystallin family protein [Solirubrobacteraceae bacterium]|nr:Hsp20/alpha crystallin family protein [Solirubrobacteraceae bacterium]
MALIRWEPVRELGTIQSDMNRLFSSFFDTPTTANSRMLRRWIPAMDLVETDGAFVLKADLPGLSESDVNIEVADRVLTISGERKSEHQDRKAGYYRVERSYGSFRRSLTLPEGVDADAVKATFANGVLEVTVPKPVTQAPRKVQIAVGSVPAGDAEAIEGSPEAPAAEAPAAEAPATEAPAVS